MYETKKSNVQNKFYIKDETRETTNSYFITLFSKLSISCSPRRATKLQDTIVAIHFGSGTSVFQLLTFRITGVSLGVARSLSISHDATKSTNKAELANSRPVINGYAKCAEVRKIVRSPVPQVIAISPLKVVAPPRAQTRELLKELAIRREASLRI